MCSCAGPVFVASKFHIYFNGICTTSELLVRQRFRTSTAWSTLLYNSQCVTFLLALLHTRFATRDSRNMLVIFPLHFSATLVSLDSLTRRALGLPSLCIFARSDFLVCSGVTQCVGDYHRIISFLWFSPWHFRMLQSTFTPKFAIPSLMKGTLRWMPAITERSFLDNHPFCQRSTSPFLKDFFPACVPFSKEFRRGEPDAREPLPFPLDSRVFSGSCFILEH